MAWMGGSQDALYLAWVVVGERLASFNEQLRDELLDREVFYTFLEVRVLTERYRQTYNRLRPRNSLGYRPPAPEALLPADTVPVLVGLSYRVVQTSRTGQFCIQNSRCVSRIGSSGSSRSWQDMYTVSSSLTESVRVRQCLESMRLST